VKSLRRSSVSVRASTRASAGESLGRLVELSARLAEAEETLRAIGSGEVDAVVVAGKSGDQVFTLHGEDQVYRLLIESMNEGALTLTADKVIIFANRCFARMVKCPLEQVVGSSFRRFLSVKDQAELRSLMKKAAKSGTKIQLTLQAGKEAGTPVQISVRELPANGSRRLTIGMVVTDLTEARRTESLLRSLTHRVVQGQEAERGRVALELHDHITQLLCAILFRCQALVDELSSSGGPSLQEAMRLRAMLSQTAEEVERIARKLRPGVLDQLGLEAVLEATRSEFEDRTGMKLRLTGAPLSGQLPAGAELAFYRILQEALKNVEAHADARHVSVDLRQQGAVVQLTIKDDGRGFDPDRLPVRRKGKGGLGLLGMRERANAAGGTVTVKSGRGAGTEIEAIIPLTGSAAAPGPGGAGKKRSLPAATRVRVGPSPRAVAP
jgi:PAS domain S-box-containing protein